MMNNAPLDRALEEARAAEPVPPQGFVASVMRRIHETQARMSAWRSWRRAARATNLLSSAGVDPSSAGIVGDRRRRFAATGGIMKRNIIWTAAAVGAVAVVGFVW